MLSDLRSENNWLNLARAAVLRGEYGEAASMTLQALREHPDSFDLRRLLAGVYLHTDRESDAESLLTNLLLERPGDVAASFTLARILLNQCRGNAAAKTLCTCFEHTQNDTESCIQATELLHSCGRARDAKTIIECALRTRPDDPRLHAYAGMLDIQLGEFRRARTHYLYALDHAPKACEWHIPHGLALTQRYRDATHPDFVRFQNCLKRDDLSDKAHSTILFALAKAHDDIGDFAKAAKYSRQANALARNATQWQAKQWRRAVEARLNTRPLAVKPEPQPDFFPIFVVGVPRSGTTLVSELLARRPQVCNRGESPWLATLAQQAKLIENPNMATLQRASKTYAAQLRQDDTCEMRWYIDKQPLNFRYVDLIMALFPNAKVIYCRRDARDTALSLWMQSFHEEVQGYAYDFSSIALVMRDCERIMTRWRKLYKGSIREVSYERLVHSPDPAITDLAEWLGLPRAETCVAPKLTPSHISTASLWQARQPIFLRSAGRWKNYVQYVPELSGFKAGDY